MYAPISSAGLGFQEEASERPAAQGGGPVLVPPIFVPCEYLSNLPLLSSHDISASLVIHSEACFHFKPCCWFFWGRAEEWMGCSGTYWVGGWDQNRGVGCPIINCVSGPPLRVSWRLRISRSIPLNRWVPNMNIPSHNIPRPSSFILPPDNGSLSYRPLDGQWSPIRPDINISHLTSPVSVCLVCHPLVTITINNHIRNCLVGWSALWSIFCENFHC